MGYTVYDFPNDAHLDAPKPEDHTYYSETGWPGSSPKWWRHAIDIMPPAAGSGLPPLQKVGQVLATDRNSGKAGWLKYMNWPSTGDLSRAVQNYWEDSTGQRPSSDTGHIHLSSTTGVETSSMWDSYDIAARLRGVVPSNVNTNSTSEGEAPMFLAQGSDGQLYLCDGKDSDPTDVSALADKQTLVSEGRIPPIIGVGKGYGDFYPRGGWTERAFGKLRTAAPTPVITDAQVAAITNNLAEVVTAALAGADHQLTEQQIIDAVKAALQQGVGTLAKLHES